MATVRCSNCGTPVRVRGLGSICPECGLLVTVGEEEAAQIDPTFASQQSVEPRPLPVQFKPSSEPTRETTIHLYFIIGGLAALVIVLTATVIILLTREPVVAPVVMTPPPPPPPTRTTEPRGSEWFSENPSVTSPTPPLPSPRGASAPTVASNVPPTPATTQASTMPAAPPPPHVELARIRPRAGASLSSKVTDVEVGAAMERGIKYLKAQFTRTRLRDAEKYDTEVFQGTNALAVYALLHAGQAVGDEELAPQSILVRDFLDRLKELPMTGQKATYSRSLRIAALGVYNRPEDKQAIVADADWLRKSSMEGAYTYSMPPQGRTRAQNIWDNSNSQYGALGLWAAAEAGVPSPSTYWKDVEEHWKSTQVLTGGWGYSPGAQSATLAMTAAGATMLFVARDQQALANNTATAFTPLSPQIENALEWLDEGDHAVKIDGHQGYTLYGIERAGLASGYKYFGTHDWYAELAKRSIELQRPDGSWAGADREVAETAFNLLFLARGRSPVLISKLSFEGNWSNRPRDVAALTRFASYQLERPVNWEIGDIRRSFFEWSDAPVLLITSDKAPAFRDADVEKIADFARWGGLVFLHAERGNAEFSTFAADLAARAFPQYRYEAIPESHPVYSTVVPLNPRPELFGVSNGSRLLLVHSPKDLNSQWQTRPPRNQRAASDTALNIAIYATGRTDMRNRLSSTYIAAPLEQPAGVVPVARVKYEGNWDPEPAAWNRMGRLLQIKTGVSLRPLSIALDELSYADFPIAHLTGTDAPKLTALGIESLRTFVDSGGLLIIDACGGSTAFSDAVTTDLLPKLFPESTAEPVPMDGSMIVSERPGMKDLSTPLYRQETPRDRPLMMLRHGKGTVVVSSLDITTGLLGATTVGIRGYQPQYAQDLVQNLIFWALSHIAGVR